MLGFNNVLAKQCFGGLTPNKPYKSLDSNSVYYLTSDCFKKAFVNPQVYFTYFDSWSDVKVVSSEILDNIPFAKIKFIPKGPKYNPPLGTLVKTINDPKVYVLLADTDGQTKRYWLKDENVFNSLKYDWQWIEDVSEEFLNKYPLGQVIDYTNHHPNYALIKYPNDPKVYRLEPDPENPDKQVKRHIADEDTFINLGYRWDRIIEIQPTEQYIEGEKLQLKKQVQNQEEKQVQNKQTEQIKNNPNQITDVETETNEDVIDNHQDSNTETSDNNQEDNNVNNQPIILNADDDNGNWIDIGADTMGPVHIESYSNQQNIDYSKFKVLSQSDFNGQTYYVATNGSDDNPGTIDKPLLTLNKALSLAQADDKIILRQGEYRPEYTGLYALINIDKSIYIGGYTNEKVVIKPPSDFKNKAINIDANNKVMLENLEISGFKQFGVSFWSQNYKQICLKDLKINLDCGYFCEGIVFYSDDIGTVTDSFSIINVEINGADIGLSCNYGPCNNWYINGLKINNRQTNEGSGLDCLAVESGENIFIKNTQVENCSGDGIDLKASRVLLVNNIIKHTTRNGLKLWHGGDVINNLIYKTGADASLVLAEQGEYNLYNCVIANHNYQNSERAFMISIGYDNPNDEIKVSITNSIIANNNGEVIGFPNLNNSSRILNLYNNIFYNVEYENIDLSQQIIKNPLFISDEDYHLQNSSPGIDKGIITNYSFDINNQERLANQYDLGVYEN